MLYSYILVCVRVTFNSFELKISDKVTYVHHNTPDCTAFRLHELSKFIYKGVFCHRGVLGSHQLAFARLNIWIQEIIVQNTGRPYTLVQVLTLNIFLTSKALL